MRELNRGIRILKETPNLALFHAPLDGKSLEIRVYADASFSSNDDLSSQVGFIILLCHGYNKCHIIDYSSYKSRRTVKSVMGAEVCAFIDAFDKSFMMSADLSELLSTSLRIMIYTDSKQLFDAMTKGRRTTEKRLATEISAARQSYRRFEIHAVGLVRGENNPAEGLSKLNGKKALQKILTMGIDEIPVELWIERTQVQSTNE